jgi:serine/threonine protein kinase
MAKQPEVLKQAIPTASNGCLDFLSKLLVFNPHCRFSAAEAMRHRWLSHLYVASDEAAFMTGAPLIIDGGLTGTK